MSDSDEELTRTLRNREVPVVENALIAEITKQHRTRKQIILSDSEPSSPENAISQENELDRATRLIKQDLNSGINPFGTTQRLIRSPETTGEATTSTVFETYEKTIENLSDSLSSLHHSETHKNPEEQPNTSQFFASTPQVNITTQTESVYIDDDLNNLPPHLNLIEQKEELFSDLNLRTSPVQEFLNLHSESENRSFPKPKKIQFNNSALEPILENPINNQTEMTETFDYTLFHRMIPEYDGNKDSLNRFIACCDQFLSKYTDVNNRALFMQALVRKLTDRAFEFYNKQTITTWEIFKEAFRKYFASQQSFEGYQIELAKVKQNNMSVRKYGEKIEKILNEINKICADIKVDDRSGEQFFKVQNERLAIKSFINGLNDPYKNIMRSRKFLTMNQAILDAIELETDEVINLQTLRISETAPTTQNLQNTQNSISNTNQNNGSNNNSNNNPNNNSNNNNPGARNNERRPVVCFKCGIPNHKANECFRRPFQVPMPNTYRDNFNRFLQRNNYQSIPVYRAPTNSYPAYGQNFRNNNNFNYQTRFQPQRSFQNDNFNQNYSNRVTVTGRPDYAPRFNRPNQYNFMQNAQNNYTPRNPQNNSTPFNGNPTNSNHRFNQNSNQETNTVSAQRNTNPFRNQNSNPFNSNPFNSNNRSRNIQSCTETKNEAAQSSQLDGEALNFLIA